MNEFYYKSPLIDIERSNTCAQIEWGNITMPEPNLPAIEELRNTSIDNIESDMYFYHSDLPIAIGMGSSSWITDASGDVNQHIQYLAFGEDFIYQRNSSWNVPYTFSGKEKDAETGYSYFGARYYDSDLSIWLSVDPLADKRIWESPYSYCGNNLVNRFDEDGRFWHIIAGAVIGAAATTIKLAINGEDFTKGKTWAKIGLGAGTGAAIAAMPFSAVGVVGAGGVGFASDILDQSIDKASNGEDVLDLKSYNYKKAAVSGLITAGASAIGGAWGKNLRSKSIDKNWVGSLKRTTLMKQIYKHPQLGGVIANGVVDISNAIINSSLAKLNSEVYSKGGAWGVASSSDIDEKGNIKNDSSVYMGSLKTFEIVADKSSKKQVDDTTK